MTLSRNAHGNFATKDYSLMNAKDASGYDIINLNTGQIEMWCEQEPQGVIALQWLQEAYDEIMEDPEAIFRQKRAESSGRLAMLGGITKRH